MLQGKSSLLKDVTLYKQPNVRGAFSLRIGHCQNQYHGSFNHKVKGLQIWLYTTISRMNSQAVRPKHLFFAQSRQAKGAFSLSLLRDALSDYPVQEPLISYHNTLLFQEHPIHLLICVTQRCQNNLETEEQSGGLTLLNLKTYHKATKIKCGTRIKIDI